MALDPGSPTEHNGRVDGLGPQAETGAVGKATAIGAFRLYDVGPTKTEHPETDEESAPWRSLWNWPGVRMTGVQRFSRA